MNPATQLMVAALRKLAAEGWSYADAAEISGASYHYVACYARKYKIDFIQCKRGRKAVTSDLRSEDMLAKFQSGMTLAEIGVEYAVSRERVRQIMHKYHGTRAADGGQAEQARAKRKAFNKKRSARAMSRWGCTYAQYVAIMKHPGKPTIAYSQQKKNADQRSIGWELNLWQWWTIWQTSGHWPERGRGRGYHMCRLNDAGPYAADNVYIATGVENMQDYWADIRSEKRTRHIAPAVAA